MGWNRDRDSGMRSWDDQFIIDTIIRLGIRHFKRFGTEIYVLNWGTSNCCNLHEIMKCSSKYKKWEISRNLL